MVKRAKQSNDGNRNIMQLNENIDDDDDDVTSKMILQYNIYN